MSVSDGWATVLKITVPASVILFIARRFPKLEWRVFT
jgi:hypothetical protein